MVTLKLDLSMFWFIDFILQLVIYTKIILIGFPYMDLIKQQWYHTVLKLINTCII